MGIEKLLSDICGTNFMTDIMSVLSENLLSGGGKFSGVYAFARGLYNAVMPVGVYLLFIYFIVSLVNKVSSEQFTWEQLWRLLAMLVASKFIMEHGFDIMEKLFGVGQAIMQLVSNSGEITAQEVQLDTESVLESMRESLGFKGILKVLGDAIIWLSLLIPWLISWILRIAVNVICYSRLIEIYLRVIFAPLALSDFFANGLSGTGWRFLKGFFAVSLQGAMIYGIGIIYSALVANIAYTEGTNIFTFLIPVIAIAASCVMLMFRALPLAREIVGAQ